MNAPAAALAWEIWWRHPRGLAGVAAVVAGFAAYCAAVPVTAQFAAVSSIWFVMGLCYVVGVFAYGFEARLETAESGFPARLFVLPVRTAVLVGWPMLQGVAAAVGLWLAWDGLVLRPTGVETPGGAAGRRRGRQSGAGVAAVRRAVAAAGGNDVRAHRAGAGYREEPAVRAAVVAAAVRFVGGWVAAAAALGTLLVWLVPSRVMSPEWLAAAAVLFVPLARLAAAPRALAWNRHR